jgi:hypothetical protein
MGRFVTRGAKTINRERSTIFPVCVSGDSCQGYDLQHCYVLCTGVRQDVSEGDEGESIVNIALWIVQILLALLFLYAG